MRSEARTSYGGMTLSGRRAAPDAGLDLVRPEDNRRQLFDFLARFDLSSGPLAVLVLAAVTTAAPESTLLKPRRR